VWSQYSDIGLLRAMKLVVTEARQKGDVLHVALDGGAYQGNHKFCGMAVLCATWTAEMTEQSFLYEKMHGGQFIVDKFDAMCSI
jgi:IMP dehydrogenase/GMP reductase